MAAARTNVPRKSSVSLKSPLLQISHGRGSSSRSLFVEATITKLNITSNALDTSRKATSNFQMPAVTTELSDEQTLNPDQIGDHSPREGSKPKLHQQDDARYRHPLSAPFRSKDKSISQEKTGAVYSGWLSWLSKPKNLPLLDSDGGNKKPENNEASDLITNDPFVQTSGHSQSRIASQDQRLVSDPTPLGVDTETNSQPRTWFGLWNNRARPLEETHWLKATPQPEKDPNESLKPQHTENISVQNVKSPLSISEAQVKSPEVAKSTGWGFWSRENSKGNPQPNDKSGKLALAGSLSETRPESASIGDVTRVPSRLLVKGKPKALEINRGQEPLIISKPVGNEEHKPKDLAANSKVKLTEHTRRVAKTSITNLVLPSLRQTFGEIENPNLIQRFSRFLRYNRLSDTRHVKILPNPPRVKRALAIVRKPHS